jgi:hypothetical protein
MYHHGSVDHFALTQPYSLSLHFQEQSVTKILGGYKVV